MKNDHVISETLSFACGRDKGAIRYPKKFKENDRRNARNIIAQLTLMLGDCHIRKADHLLDCGSILITTQSLLGSELLLAAQMNHS